ncbi:MAG: hypothetical protein J0M12_02005 [Deltaproteobacteria bacterium]|nr:hypothetical protein [Deltaproteobacteria bacterium]
MSSNTLKTGLFRGLLAALLALSLGLTSPKQAQAQGAYVNGDLGSFADWVCNGNVPTTNYAQILQDLLDQLSSIRFDLTMTQGGGGMVGDPTQCLPGFNPNLPNLPGLGDLTACFDFSGLGNIGGNIGSCLSGVMGQFQGLGDYFNQFNWNYNDLVNCLQGLVQIPTIPLPQFLSNLGQVLDNIIAILNGAISDYDFYNGSFNFWVDFCNNHYSANGYASGGGSGMANSVSGGSGSVTVTSGVTGGPGSAVNLSNLSATAYLKAKGSNKEKAYALRASGDKFKRTIKNLKRGTDYNVRIVVTNNQTGIPLGQTNSKVKVN